MTASSTGGSEGGLPAVGFELFADLPAGIAYLAGPDHVFRFANAAYRELLGGRDLIGRTVREALPELSRKGHVEILDRVLASGQAAETRSMELMLDGPDGELRQIFLDCVCQPVHNRAAVVGILVHAVDVTSHVGNEQRLERITARLAESEERHRILFETMPYGVVHHDSGGAIVAANPAATEILGVAEKDLVGLGPRDDRWEAVREDGSPLEADRHPAMVALSTGRVTEATLMGVTHGRTGQNRWLSVIGVPLERYDDGRPGRAYAMFSDVTDQLRAAASLQERDSFLGRLRDANVLGVVTSSEGRVTDANDAFLHMVGRDRQDLAAGRVDWQAMTPPEWHHRNDRALEELRSTGACQPFEKQFLHTDGTRVPVLVGAAVVERDPLRWVTFAVDLSERERAEKERATLVASAEAASAEAARAEEELRLLMRAGALAASTHDPEQLLEHSTRLLVPSVADVALVLLPGDGGLLVPVVALHHDPHRSSVAVAGDQSVAPSDRGVTAPLRTGRPVLLQQLSDPGVRRANLDSWSEHFVVEMGADSVIAAPLGIAERNRGVLVVGRAASTPPFSPSDVAVIEELARRLAVGLANAETFAREHTVSETLQRALLPHIPSSFGRVDLAVEYLPATAGAEVGGDWFDVFPLSDTSLALLVGDVMGHGIEAAAVMGQVRTIMHTYAIDTSRPAAVLERTNAVMAKMLPGATATALCAVLDTATGELAYANAGHPPPLLSTPTAARYLTGGGGPLLGAIEEAGYSEGRVALGAGSAVLLYTDGLIEDRDRDIDTGLAQLRATMAERVPSSAAQMCSTALASLLGAGHRSDDICLLALRMPD